MLDFTPDFVEILRSVRSATRHRVGYRATRRRCIRSLTCEPHEESHVDGSRIQGDIGDIICAWWDCSCTCLVPYAGM